MHACAYASARLGAPAAAVGRGRGHRRAGYGRMVCSDNERAMIASVGLESARLGWRLDARSRLPLSFCTFIQLCHYVQRHFVPCTSAWPTWFVASVSSISGCALKYSHLFKCIPVSDGVATESDQLKAERPAVDIVHGGKYAITDERRSDDDDDGDSGAQRGAVSAVERGELRLYAASRGRLSASSRCELDRSFVGNFDPPSLSRYSCPPPRMPLFVYTAADGRSVAAPVVDPFFPFVTVVGGEQRAGWGSRYIVWAAALLLAEGEQDEQFVEAVQTALVSRVEIGSPAYFAGLRSGQRILAVDGVPVSDRSYIDIVKLIADSRTQLVLMIVTGFDASATSSPMLADSPGPIANGRGDLSSSLTSVSTAVAVPSVAHSVDWSQQSATSSSTPVSWNEHGDQEGRIGALLGEMRPQRARLAASSSPLSTAYSRPVWVRAQPVSSAEPPPYLRGAVSHDNFAHISSVDCSSTASSNGTNFRRGDVYRLPQPSNQLLSRTVSQESTASDTHLHHHHHPVVGRSISATTDNGCMKRAFSTGLGPSHRPLVKQVPPSPSALPPYSASGYQRSSVADPQSRWPMPSIYESEPALTFYTTQPASSTTRPLMAPVSRGYFVTSNHATNGGDAHHHHEEDEVAANAEWASSVDANGNDSPIRIRSPHSPISHLKRFAANDWDRRLLTAADSSPTSNGNLNDSRRYTVRQASFIAAVSGQTSSPPLFCFSGATGTTPPSTSRPSRQSVVSRLLVGADPFICMRRPSPSAHDDGRLRMSKRLRRGSLRLSTTSGANVDRRPLRTRSAHSRRPPARRIIVDKDDGRLTRPR
uniref:PDZ domain-containing protein n=1 Tax=Plectus sambesii TaxID=2011161 RepID=A0A914VLQ2_9BILA